MQEAMAKCQMSPIKTAITGTFAKTCLITKSARFILVCLLLNLAAAPSKVDCSRGWIGHGTHPKMTIDYLHGPLADTLRRFKGNNTQIDNFKIVVEDGPALFVGGT